MLHDPAHHERLREQPWDESRVRACITRIVAGLQDEFIEGFGWRVHPLDEPDDPDAPNPSLYFGTCGVIWALNHLRAVGAAPTRRRDWLATDELLDLTRRWLGADAERERASYLMGETPIRMLEFGLRPSDAGADSIARLIESNLDHPSRELMWGAPGTLLAALWMHRRTGAPRWAELFCRTAARLKQQMRWSDAHACWYWTQDLYGMSMACLDAVHGFAGTALPLIAGRELLEDWPDWQARIGRTMQSTAKWEDGAATWPVTLDPTPGQPDKKLMQLCHGAPGFVICLAGFPGTELDPLLVAAGEATWRAGPLTKGSNLCHGTGGNGYAFLKLYRRSGDPRWLARSRAFAMHGIDQFEAHAERYGRLRASLWTGDAGFAVYLWDCLRGEAGFPTLDLFYA